MASYTIKVRFNTDRQEIRIDPARLSAAFGTDNIYWIQAGVNAPSWTFNSLTITPTTAINSLTVTSQTMSVVDWNTATAVQTISYKVSVNYNNTVYMSDPYILNDPDVE